MDMSDARKALLVERIGILSDRKKLLDIQKRLTWKLGKRLEAKDECIAGLDKTLEEAAELRDVFAKLRARAVGDTNLEAEQFEIRCLALQSKGIDLAEFEGFEDGDDAAADGCASLLVDAL